MHHSSASHYHRMYLLSVTVKRLVGSLAVTAMTASGKFSPPVCRALFGSREAPSLIVDGYVLLYSVFP